MGESATANPPAEARRWKGGLLWQARPWRDGSVGDESEAGAASTTTQASLPSLQQAASLPPPPLIRGAQNWGSPDTVEGGWTTQGTPEMTVCVLNAGAPVAFQRAPPASLPKREDHALKTEWSQGNTLMDTDFGGSPRGVTWLPSCPTMKPTGDKLYVPTKLPITFYHLTLKS